MARLYKTAKKDNEQALLLLENLEIADSLWKRGKGLLGRKKIAADEALWIKPGNNIHTFFMKFKIDCIFLDRKMEIHKIVPEVSAFKFVGPFWRAFSVIEAPAGFAEMKNLKAGDQLYVVS